MGKLTEDLLPITFSGEFRRVIATGKRFRRPSVTVIISSSEDTEALSMVGITVSKRVGNAVVRNLVRRRIRSVLRMHSWARGFSMVIITERGADKTSFVDLSSEIVSAGREAQVLGLK